MYLEKINGPADVKALSSQERTILASEIRQALIEKLSRHGGHCGPNLGLVEATIALHTVFDSPKDRFVFDVSHQTYTHKMLTGRSYGFLDPQRYDDVTGYSTPEESAHDPFTLGHTSTSVSLACGLAKARDAQGEHHNVIAVIGDGSLSGGEALEGLDLAGEMDGNLIIIVNDNGMSIAENHGGIYKNLDLLRQSGGTAECNLFRSMGLDYVFQPEGNNTDALIKTFRQVKDCPHPVVVHIVTEKGKGYAPAEKHKEIFHWHEPFDVPTGESIAAADAEDYGDLTAQYLLQEMQQDSRVVAITSGTPTVFGFTEERRKAAGSQFVDVGIAEETAVALASGLAAGGAKPVYGVYSSFLQRTYDQLSQDLCINNNPATLLVFAASVYGMNDITHLGIFDIPMIANIPNLVYLAPSTKEEYFAMLRWSMTQREHPVAIRVPGCGVQSDSKTITKDFGKLNTYTVTQKGSEVALIGLGSFYPLAQQAAAEYEKRTGVRPTLINPYYITGLDKPLLADLSKTHRTVVTIEDGVLDGGFGQKIAAFYGNTDTKVLCYGLKKEFLDRYDAQTVLEQNRLTPGQIADDLQKL